LRWTQPNLVFAMYRFFSPAQSSRIGRVAVALCCFCSLLPLNGPLAQSQAVSGPTPVSLTSAADEVNKAGYSLKQFGLATNEWPILRVDFSIERADQTIFKNLTLADVEPKLDGKPLVTRAGDLLQKDGQGAGVFVLLDGSGSMSSARVDKLSAAKRGLETLIDKLKPNARVGLISFDEEQRVIIEPTTDKARVKQEVERFTIRPEKSRFTRLYDAVEFGLTEAAKNGIKNLLVISDGWEDTPETRKLDTAGIENLKRRREEGITRISRDNNIRVFTVAIGDERGEGLNYVDRIALDNISKGANGGGAAYIEVKGDLGSRALEETVLLSRLQQILDDLKQWFQYSYSLTLRVDESMQSSAKEHKLWVGFTVGDEPRVQLPIEYTYVLQASGAPVVTTATVQKPIFIRAAPRGVKWQQLLFIYVVLLLGLVILAVVPSVFQALSRGGRALRVRRAIVKLGARSPLVGVPCPNEGTAAGRVYLFKEGDIVLVCPNCKTSHHLSCWTFNEHQCMQRNCEMELIVPLTILESHGLTERNLSEETSWMTS
jgi:Mg-chelatase subunit ChlD